MPALVLLQISRHRFTLTIGTLSEAGVAHTFYLTFGGVRPAYMICSRRSCTVGPILWSESHVLPSSIYCKLNQKHKINIFILFNGKVSSHPFPAIIMRECVTPPVGSGSLENHPPWYRSPNSFTQFIIIFNWVDELGDVHCL